MDPDEVAMLVDGQEVEPPEPLLEQDISHGPRWEPLSFTLTDEAEVQISEDDVITVNGELFRVTNVDEDQEAYETQYHIERVEDGEDA